MVNIVAPTTYMEYSDQPSTSRRPSKTIVSGASISWIISPIFDAQASLARSSESGVACAQTLEEDTEENAFEVNVAAAEEIARQLRLRDMGGIIVIDFIDMHDNENKQNLFEKMRELMTDDRAKHNILPLSKFGLIQLTRQRVRPEITINLQEDCPVCYGKGIIQPSILFEDILCNKA